MKITKVFDANVYVDNASKHGQASEVVLPNITAVMSDYAPLGMVGSTELFNGFDKMESQFTWTYPDNDAQKACANFMKPVDLVLRSSKAEYDNGGIQSEQPIVVNMRGYPKEHQGGTFASKQDVQLQTTFHIIYMKQEIDGEVIVEIDVYNNIYKVGRVDLLAERRQNLGI